MIDKQVNRGARRIAPVLAVALLMAGSAVVLAAPAHAQSPRTWVSGVGDDANPCSLTLPCKTFAGAIAKTAAAGEINALDSSGFGGLTITKSITIDASSVLGGVLASGSNAIVVNAGPTDNVVLRGLDIQGLDASPDAVKVMSARTVSISNTRIKGFNGAGIDVLPSAANTAVFVDDVQIQNMNGDGISVAPTGGRTATVAVNDSRIFDVATGFKVADGAKAYLYDSVVFKNSIGVRVLGTGLLDYGDTRNRIVENTTNFVLPPSVQTVSGTVPTSVTVGALAALPQKTNKGANITWTSNTPVKCSIQTTNVKGVAAGACTVHAASPATSSLVELNQDFAVTVVAAPSAQTVSGTVPKTVKVGAVAALPLKTNKGSNITWTSKTPTKCTIQTAKVKGVATAACTLHAASPATATLLALSLDYAVTVTK